jgi:hypothetical protein
MFAVSLVCIAYSCGQSQEMGASDSPPVFAIIHYETQCLVITSGDEVAVVRFTNWTPDSAKYIYRHLDKDGKVSKGAGTVAIKVVKVEKIKEPGLTRQFLDEKLATIAIGGIRLKWSNHLNNAGSYHYLPEILSVQLAHPLYFEEIDLKRYKVKK